MCWAGRVTLVVHPTENHGDEHDTEWSKGLAGGFVLEKCVIHLYSLTPSLPPNSLSMNDMRRPKMRKMRKKQPKNGAGGEKTD